MAADPTASSSMVGIKQPQIAPCRKVGAFLLPARPKINKWLTKSEKALPHFFALCIMHLRGVGERAASRWVFGSFGYLNLAYASYLF